MPDFSQERINASVRSLSVALLDASDFIKQSLSPAERKKSVQCAATIADSADGIRAELAEAKKDAKVKSSLELADHVQDVDENLKLLRNLVKDFPKASDRKNIFEQMNARYAEVVKGLTVILAEFSEN